MADRRRFAGRLVAICAAGIGVPAAAASAAAPYPAREVGAWTVAASADGTGCFLTRDYDRAGETTLLFGIDGDGANRLSVLNANWSIRPKERVELSFRLAANRYSGQFAVGLASAGKQGFVTSFGAKFSDQLAAAQTLEIYRGKVPVERLDLAGSGAAMTELRTCVDLQRKAAARDKDRGDSIPRDPFAARAGRKGRD